MATYTYDPTLPTPKDRARDLLGDTAVSPGTTTIPQDDALLSNEYILGRLAAEPSFEHAVAWMADKLAMQIALEPVKVSVEGIAVDFSPRIPGWEKLAARMRAIIADREAAARAAASRPAGSITVPTIATW